MTAIANKFRELNYLIELATTPDHEDFPVETAVGALSHSQLLNVLKHGSDTKKETLLAGAPFNISFDDLTGIQAELETIFYQSTLKFWWW